LTEGEEEELSVELLWRMHARIGEIGDEVRRRRCAVALP
jgi:hypothetical protein